MRVQTFKNEIEPVDPTLDFTGLSERVISVLKDYIHTNEERRQLIAEMQEQKRRCIM